MLQSPGSQTPQRSAYLSFTLKVYLGQTHHETSKSISVTSGTVSVFLFLVGAAIFQVAAADLTGRQHLQQREGGGEAAQPVGQHCCSALR